ncbi:hypothetical protein BE15_33880 [Sorangium cellulosum]|uniref:Uncharacterized protein n=1 Tax=Sorangium cellulosum TaxID=56 RepID=A0A150QX34_SORCE|nr:hypothetical protein BE15_33880 [Sorangium cellulosum]
MARRRRDGSRERSTRAAEPRAPSPRCYAPRVQRWILVAVIVGLHLLAFSIGLFLRRRRQRRRAHR